MANIQLKFQNWKTLFRSKKKNENDYDYHETTTWIRKTVYVYVFKIKQTCAMHENILFRSFFHPLTNISQRTKWKITRLHRNFGVQCQMDKKKSQFINFCLFQAIGIWQVMKERRFRNWLKSWLSIFGSHTIIIIIIDWIQNLRQATSNWHNDL